MDDTENARQVAERYAGAWLADDLAGIISCCAEDFTLHYFGDNPFSGDHVGRDAALDTLLRVGAKAPRRLESIDEILAGPGAAVIVATERITVGAVEHRIRRVLRYRIEGSQFAECWLYEEHQSIIDAAWS
jgi:ketosteroid isomerase-like protein